MRFCFLGSESIIGESVKLDRFGQTIELAEPEAANAILGGCPLLDGAAFDAIGFTSAELDQFRSVGSHGRAPAGFLEKKKTALIAAHELRERLKNDGKLTAAEPQGA